MQTEVINVEIGSHSRGEHSPIRYMYYDRSDRKWIEIGEEKIEIRIYRNVNGDTNIVIYSPTINKEIPMQELTKDHPEMLLDAQRDQEGKIRSIIQDIISTPKNISDMLEALKTSMSYCVRLLRENGAEPNGRNRGLKHYDLDEEVLYISRIGHRSIKTAYLRPFQLGILRIILKMCPDYLYSAEYHPSIFRKIDYLIRRGFLTEEYGNRIKEYYEFLLILYSQHKQEFYYQGYSDRNGEESIYTYPIDPEIIEKLGEIRDFILNDFTRFIADPRQRQEK